jgi:hypothetical protein
MNDAPSGIARTRRFQTKSIPPRFANDLNNCNPAKTTNRNKTGNNQNSEHRRLKCPATSIAFAFEDIFRSQFRPRRDILLCICGMSNKTFE